MYAVPRLFWTEMSVKDFVAWGFLTLPVHRHIQVSNLSIRAKYLSKVVLVDIFGELLNDDLEGLEMFNFWIVNHTFVLFTTGLRLRLRLRLRVSLLYLPFLRGLRLKERGETVRRGLDGDLESGRETSE